MPFRIEVSITDPVTKERAWYPVRGSGRNSRPYQWATYSEASEAMGRLYSDVVRDGSVRVHEVPK